MDERYKGASVSGGLPASIESALVFRMAVMRAVNHCEDERTPHLQEPNVLIRHYITEPLLHNQHLDE